MPQNHKHPKPAIHDYTPARKLREEHGLHRGVFRCDRCQRVIPEALLVEQDGYDYCSTLCAWKMSPVEQDLLLAEQTSEVDSFEPAENPASSEFDGVVTITGISPDLPIRLINDGAAVSLTFTGLGFTSSVSIAYGNAGITDDSGPTISSTEVALSLVASGVTPGYYHLDLDGSRYFNAIQVGN